MSLKKKLLEYLKQSSKRIELLYSSIKIVFISVLFLFFLLYFFVSGGLYEDILTPFLFPLYVSFVFSFVSYLCIASIKYFRGKLPIIVVMILCIFYIIFGLASLYPVF